jgi:hypothetical protein
MADYLANPEVYGTTSSGAKVVLAPTTTPTTTNIPTNTIVGAYVGDTTNFAVTDVADPADVKVAAVVPANSVTTENTTLTVTVMGTDGLVHTVTTPIKSSTAAPLAASIGVSVATQDAGISVDTTGNNITITGASNYASLGSYLTKYSPVDGSATKQVIYFTPLDQYGETSSNLSQIITTNQSLTNVVTGVTSPLVAGQSTFSIASNGAITGTPVAGLNVTLTGVTSNGLVKTVQLMFR